MTRTGKKATSAILALLLSPFVSQKRLTLREVPEAIRYLETGRARGKVIIG